MRNRFRLTALLAGALSIGVAQRPAQAETINVPCSAHTLQSVATTVNTNGEEDLVWLAPGCVYSLLATWVVDPDLDSSVRVYGRGATVTGGDQRTAFRVNAGATLHLYNVRVTGASPTGNGGGIHNLGTLTLTDSTVTDSHAPQGYGGGIYSAGTLRLARSMVSGNTSAVQAGGINNATQGRLTLTESTVSGNSSLYGGGIFNGSRAALFNSTLFGNGAFVGGGILNVGQGTATLSNVTISANAVSGSDGGGGILNEGALELDNSILANTLFGIVDCYNSGTITASGANLVEDGSCAVAGALAGDPKLGDPSGKPASVSPLAGSPAIDAGSNASCPGIDQRGRRRPWDGNGDGTKACDLGAVERGACGLLGIEAFLVLPFARRLARSRGRAGRGGA